MRDHSSPGINDANFPVPLRWSTGPLQPKRGRGSVSDESAIRSLIIDNKNGARPCDDPHAKGDDWDRPRASRGDHLVETRDTASSSTSTPDPPAAAVNYQYVWSPVYVDTPILRDVYKYDGYNVQMQGTVSTSTGVSRRVYYMTDANANVTALADPSGNVVERYSYDAFGKATVYDSPVTANGHTTDWTNPRTVSSADNTRLFAGEQLDAKTGLYYDRARWYDSSTGGFISRDPAEADANLYRYAGNDPTGMVDPSGMADDGSGYTGGTGGGGPSENVPPGANKPSTATPTCFPNQPSAYLGSAPNGYNTAGGGGSAPQSTASQPELFTTGGGSGHPVFSTGSKGSFSSASGSNPTQLPPRAPATSGAYALAAGLRKNDPAAKALDEIFFAASLWRTNHAPLYIGNKYVYVDSQGKITSVQYFSEARDIWWIKGIRDRIGRENVNAPLNDCGTQTKQLARYLTQNFKQPYWKVVIIHGESKKYGPENAVKLVANKKIGNTMPDMVLDVYQAYKGIPPFYLQTFGEFKNNYPDISDESE